MSIEHVAGYLDGQFETVQGWCIPQLWNVIQPLHEYQVAQGIVGPIAEIGVFHGKFFIGLALTKKGEGQHAAFDVFDMQRFNLDGAGRGNLDTFRANLQAAEFSEDDVQIRRVDSMAIGADDLSAIRTAHGAFSMFSVDGCHMAEHTINDFRIAMGLTQPGGIIFVDDYLNPDWPGVQEGLARLYLNDRPTFVPLAYTSNKLITCHISYAKDMLAHLRAIIPDAFPDCRLKLVERFGYPCLNVRPKTGAAYLKRDVCSA